MISAIVTINLVTLLIAYEGYHDIAVPLTVLAFLITFCFCTSFINKRHGHLRESTSTVKKYETETGFFEETSARCVSLIHTVATVPGAILYLTRTGYIDDEKWIQVQSITAAYLLYDALYLCIMNLDYPNEFPLDVGMLLHHTAFYLGIRVIPVEYEWYTAMAYLAEITNPFLYVGWYMHKTGKSRIYPNLYTAIGVCLVSTFFVFRIVNFSYLTYIVSGKSSLGFIVIATLTIMNVNWFLKLLHRLLPSRSSPATILKKTE